MKKNRKRSKKRKEGLVYQGIYFLEGMGLYLLLSWIYFQEIVLYVPFFVSCVLVFLLACVSYGWFFRRLFEVKSRSSLFFSQYYGLVGFRFIFFALVVLGIFYFDSVRIVDYLIMYLIYFIIFLKTESIGFSMRFYKGRVSED